ncbi:trypsin-1-like [Cloeon dipterum]|uniref:trypsin-1-like n=1 Tax=Cloeon dipterum TaxID=197152 RepID=UPI00321FB907
MQDFLGYCSFLLLLSLTLVQSAPQLKQVEAYYDDYDATTSAPDCDCVCGVPNPKTRVVGGNVTMPNEFPWVVALERRNKFYCGATLISSKHVLTAAHCIDGFNTREIKVYMGVHNRLAMNSETTLVRKIKKAVVHPKFDIFSFDNDIAMLHLNEEVEFTQIIKPACLPTQARSDYSGYNGIVAGWGRLGEKKSTAIELMKVDVPMMTMEQCRKSGYGETRITDNMICAGYTEGKKDACQGDSGGPMHINIAAGVTELIGIVSWGRGCARPNFPGVYTNVATYLDWINNQMTSDECVCKRP